MARSSTSGQGRPKGAKNKKITDQIRAIEESGLTPLDYMLQVMRDEDAPAVRRDDMAKAAAPYVNPKLASVEHKGPDGGPLILKIIDYASARKS